MFCEACGLHRDQLGLAGDDIRDCPDCGRSTCTNCWNQVAGACLTCRAFALPIASAPVRSSFVPAACRDRRGRGAKAPPHRPPVPPDGQTTAGSRRDDDARGGGGARRRHLGLDLGQVRSVRTHPPRPGHPGDGDRLRPGDQHRGRRVRRRDAPGTDRVPEGCRDRAGWRVVWRPLERPRAGACADTGGVGPGDGDVIRRTRRPEAVRGRHEWKSERRGSDQRFDRLDERPDGRPTTHGPLATATPTASPTPTLDPTATPDPTPDPATPTPDPPTPTPDPPTPTPDPPTPTPDPPTPTPDPPTPTPDP